MFHRIGGKIDPAAAELLKKAAAVQKAADFWSELYQQRPVELEAAQG